MPLWFLNVHMAWNVARPTSCILEITEFPLEIVAIPARKSGVILATKMFSN